MVLYLKKNTLLVGVLFTLLFSGCQKEDIYSEELFGTWTYANIQLIGNFADSTIAMSGTCVFKSSKEIGQSGYGELAEADAELPYWTNTGIVKKKKTIYLGPPIEPRNYNYKNTYHGLFAEQVAGNTYQNTSFDMVMYSKNKLRIFLTISDATSKKYSLFQIELTR